MRESAYHFVRTRLALSNPQNDGMQTAKEGNPVFKAQHATGTDSRKSLAFSMGIELGRPLSEAEIDTVVDKIVDWLMSEKSRANKTQATLKEF
jgi:hypothetical protein